MNKIIKSIHKIKKEIKKVFTIKPFIRPKGVYLVPEDKMKSIFWMCAVAAVATGTSSYVGGILSNPIAHTLLASHPGHNYSNTIIIIALTFAVLVGYLIGNLITPIFLKKIGAKKFLVFALILQAVANILLTTLGVTDPFNHIWLVLFALFQLMSGFGFGFAMTTINFLVVSAFKNNDESGSWLTKVHGCFGLGVVIISFLSGIILTGAGNQPTIWRASFAIISIILFGAAYIVWKIKINENKKYFKESELEQGKMIRKIHASHSNMNSHKRKIASRDKTLWSKINWIILIIGFAMFFYLFLEDSCTFYLNTAFRTSYQLFSEDSLLPILTGLFWLGITFGRWFFGIYLIGIKKFNKYKLVIFSITCVSILYILIVILLITNNSITNGDKANPNQHFKPGDWYGIKPEINFAAGKYIVLIITFFLGLFCSSVYPMTMTIGMEKGRSTTAWTTGYFVTMASLGGIFYDFFAIFAGLPSSGGNPVGNGIWWLPILFPPILIWLVIVCIHVINKIKSKQDKEERRAKRLLKK